MRRITLVLVAAMVVFSAAACGGGGEGNGSDSGATASPVPAGSPVATATPRPPAAPARYCQQSQAPQASYNVQVTARWKGKDRVVIEGSADLPGPGTVNYLICQDGEVTASLVWAIQPTFKDGKISAESKLVDSQAGPVFDPNASFEVVLSILGQPVQVPYFIISVPVEGKPD